MVLNRSESRLHESEWLTVEKWSEPARSRHVNQEIGRSVHVLVARCPACLVRQAYPAGVIKLKVFNSFSRPEMIRYHEIGILANYAGPIVK